MNHCKHSISGPLIKCHCLLMFSSCRGRMIPAELEKLIIRHRSEGHLPFFVNCTTGTTVYGAFDPIEPIADICEKYGIWLHIDVRRLNPSFFYSSPLYLLTE